MCLGKAFIDGWSDQPFLQDIAHLRVNGDGVELNTLFGEGQVVPGRVVEIDFMSSKILLRRHHETDEKG